MNLRNIFKTSNAAGQIKTFSEENLGYIRVLLLLEGIMYPLWWLTSYKYSPHQLHLDPLMSRVRVGVTCLVFLLLTYLLNEFRKRAYLLMLTGCWLITFHYMTVVQMSELAPMRIFGMFQIISCLFVSLLTLRSVLTYGVYIIILAAWVAQTPSQFPGRVLPPAFALLTLIMFLSLRVRVRLIDRLTKSRKAIHDILDNVPTGFLALSKAGLIEPGFSTASTQLFGRSDLAGRHLAEVIGQTTADERKVLDEFLTIAFAEQIPFEDAAGLAPSIIRTGSSPESTRHITLEYHPTYGVDTKSNEKLLEKIIVVATDRTLEKRLQDQVKQQQEQILAIGKILEYRQNFSDFVFSLREFVQAPPAAAQELLRALHTQKGLAQSFHLAELASHAHRLEEVAKLGVSASKLAPQLSAYRECLEQFLIENEAIIGSFGKKTDPHADRLLTHAQTQTLLRKTLSELPLGSSARQTLLETLYWDHPGKGLLACREVVQSIAERQGKKVNVTIETNSELRVHLDSYRGLFSACIHAFRNAVDHGIESLQERKAAGKSEEGLIQCTFSCDSGSKRLNLTIEDDGRGIDLSRVREVATTRGLINREQAASMTDPALFALLFKPGFTTRSETTDLSGRGVGLDAIQEETEKLGGQVWLESTLRKGTRLRFNLPLIDGLAGI